MAFELRKSCVTDFTDGTAIASVQSWDVMSRTTTVITESFRPQFSE